MITKRNERAEVNGAPPPHVDETRDGVIYDGVIYPSSDGEPMAANDYQFESITYAAKALKRRFRDVPNMYAAGDMFIYYRRGDITTRIAPDAFVVEGAKGNHPRQSWMVWVENAIPSFVLEVASGSTWERDAGEKRRIYAEMGVLEYWRFDPENGKYFREILIGERLVDEEYVPLEVRIGADGTLRGYSEFLRLDICVRLDGQIRLYDPAAGEWLLDYDESETGRVEAIRRAEANARERDIANAALRERDAQLLERDAEIERLRAALRAERG